MDAANRDDSENDKIHSSDLITLSNELNYLFHEADTDWSVSQCLDSNSTVVEPKAADEKDILSDPLACSLGIGHAAASGRQEANSVEGKELIFDSLHCSFGYLISPGDVDLGSWQERFRQDIGLGNTIGERASKSNPNLTVDATASSIGQDVKRVEDRELISDPLGCSLDCLIDLDAAALGGEQEDFSQDLDCGNSVEERASNPTLVMNATAFSIRQEGCSQKMSHGIMANDTTSRPDPRTPTVDIIDLEKEKDSIIQRMVGIKRAASLDQDFVRKLTFIVGVYNSFLTGVPQHCTEVCPTTLEPQGCCWIKKWTESQDNIKANLQREITESANVYLKTIKKRAVFLPEHCEAILKDWCEKNIEDPYMKKIQTLQFAERLGLTEKQIHYHLQNFRAKKWAGPDRTKEELDDQLKRPLRERKRKGKHFPHPIEDTSRLRAWAEREGGRHPTQEETEALSKEATSMTFKEVKVWFYNYFSKKKSKIG